MVHGAACCLCLSAGPHLETLPPLPLSVFVPQLCALPRACSALLLPAASPRCCTVLGLLPISSLLGPHRPHRPPAQVSFSSPCPRSDVSTGLQPGWYSSTNQRISGRRKGVGRMRMRMRMRVRVGYGKQASPGQLYNATEAWQEDDTHKQSRKVTTGVTCCKSE